MQLLEQDEDTLDAGLKSLAHTPLRQCFVTREKLPQEEMMRFVLSPENRVVPDLLKKLPGRGAWLKLNRPTLHKALEKQLFSRAFRKNITLPEQLETLIHHQLHKNLLASLSLANRAGLISTGAFNVEKQIESTEISAYLHARDGEEDGYRKIIALLSRKIDQNANERLHFENKSVWMKKIISRAFSREELGQAVGKEEVVHLVVRSGVGARLFEARLKQLQLLTDHE